MKTHLSKAVLVALFATFAAQAQDSCLVLKNEQQKEERYTDAQGKAATRLVTPAKVLPGDEIVWTITATNNCAKAAENVAIANPVPEHTVYVADSATGAGTAITYSLNGRDFAKQSELAVREADGKSRAAKAEDIKAVRWVVTLIPVKASTSVRFRARVQ